MRILLGLVIALYICLVSFPVQAGSFGLSPASVKIQMNQGTSQDLQFTIIGYDGLVEISSESMPVSVSPSSVTAKAGSNITVTLKCNSDAITGLYDGRIVFLAKSGNSVMSGIKVRCNLTVGNPPLGAVVIGGSSAGSSGSSMGNSGSSSAGGSSTEVTGVTSSSSAAGSAIPSLASSPAVQSTQDQGKETLPVSATESKFNYVTFGLIVVSGLTVFVLGFFGYRWIRRKKF